MQAEKLIQEMLNKPMLYGNRTVTITGYRFDTLKERIYLHTNEQQDHYNRSVDAMPEFLKQFSTVQNQVKRVSASQAIMQSVTNADELERILMDNIKKVQTNPEYIKQATAINNNVNSIININKMKLDFAKAASRLK